MLIIKILLNSPPFSSSRPFYAVKQHEDCLSSLSNGWPEYPKDGVVESMIPSTTIPSPLSGIPDYGYSSLKKGGEFKKCQSLNISFYNYIVHCLCNQLYSQIEITIKKYLKKNSRINHANT